MRFVCGCKYDRRTERMYDYVETRRQEWVYDVVHGMGSKSVKNARNRLKIVYHLFETFVDLYQHFSMFSTSEE